MLIGLLLERLLEVFKVSVITSGMRQASCKEQSNNTRSDEPNFRSAGWTYALVLTEAVEVERMHAKEVYSRRFQVTLAVTALHLLENDRACAQIPYFLQCFLSILAILTTRRYAGTLVTINAACKRGGTPNVPNEFVIFINVALLFRKVGCDVIFHEAKRSTLGL